MTNMNFLLSLDPKMVIEYLDEFRPMSLSDLKDRFSVLLTDWKDEECDPRSSVFLVLLVCDHVIGEKSNR